MRSARLLSGILLAVVLASCSSGYRLFRAPVYIELSEDFSGNALQTRFLTIHADGLIVEERDDFMSERTSHTKRRLGRLSADQMERIERALEEEQFALLPENLSFNPETGMVTVSTDAPERWISVTRDGSTRYVMTEDVEETEQGETYDRFHRLWHAILAEVEKV